MSKLINFYDRIPKGMKPKYHNPKYKTHLIEIPFRMLIVGPSGSGKTNALLQILHAMSGTFNNIILCTKNSDEPLYNYLKENVPSDCLSIQENGEIPNIDELEKSENVIDQQTLIVFDDLVLKKDQKP